MPEADMVTCERRVSWLARVDEILQDLAEGLEVRGCNITLYEGRGALEAVCGSCSLRARAWPEDPGEMVGRLGSLALDATSRGWGVVGLEILVSEGCEWLCSAAIDSLMKGGG